MTSDLILEHDPVLAEVLRRLELEQGIEERKAFDARLEDVIVRGFDTSSLDALTAKEPLDKCTSRDGRSPAPGSRDDFLTQERRYDPDLNDGVRVNIAPPQRVGLLAAGVLAAKDVPKAIADPDEIRRSRKDPGVLLFYRGAKPHWLCAVTRRENESGS